MKLIIFDLDGTVLDTLADLRGAVNHALKKYGFPERSEADIRAFVGNGVRKLCERALPDYGKSDENTERVLAEFSEYYAAHFADLTRPYPGMAELLKRLKDNGLKLAVFSNKPDEFSRELIARFYPGVFDLAVGSREGVPRKPDPAGELEIMERFGTAASETSHIGDSDTDFLTAKAAGVRFFGVSWGYRSEAELRAAGAEAVARDVGELGGFLGVGR